MGWFAAQLFPFVYGTTYYIFFVNADAVTTSAMYTISLALAVLYPIGFGFISDLPLFNCCWSVEKYGRRLPWIVISALMQIVGQYMLMNPPGETGGRTAADGSPESNMSEEDRAFLPTYFLISMVVWSIGMVVGAVSYYASCKLTIFCYFLF